MKRILILLAILVAIAAAVGWHFRDMIYWMQYAAKYKPAETFAEATTPPAPDFANKSAWAALPDRDDAADVTPPSETDAQASAQADVFYVYPTTYLSNVGWNAPLDDAEANALVDSFALKGQASAFNGCCRIYAPRYRQAGLYAFIDKTGDGEKALDLAYADVAAAFDYYLAHYNNGRPFILAGHSQGAQHLAKLLTDRLTDPAVRERMIAAYIVGYPMTPEVIGDTPVCAKPDQTGCVAAWGTYGPNATRFADPSHDICVNPLTFDTSEPSAPRTADLGALTFDDIPATVAHSVNGACKSGRLIVDDISPSAPESPIFFGRENYHILDIHWFWTNLRRNANARTSAWLAAHAVKTGAAEEPDLCRASQYADLVGKTKADVPEQPEGATWRITCDSCPVTMDFRPDRLNIFFNETSGVITKVSCG